MKKEKRYVKKINKSIAEVNQILRDNIIETNEENLKKNLNKNVFMGKIGGKRFYFYYKPSHMKNTSTVTTKISGSMSEQDGITYMRWHYSKFYLSFTMLAVITTIILITLFLLFTNQGIKGEEGLILALFVFGFLIINFGYLFLTKVSRERLKQYLDKILQ